MNVAKLIKGYLAAIASAVMFGCMPLMAKYIYADGVTPMTLVFLRNFLALPIIAAMAYSQRKTLNIPLNVLPQVGLIALLGGCATPVLLFSSYQFIASGTATVLHFIYPALVVLGGILLKRSKAQWSDVISVVFCFSGLSLFYTPGASLDWRGCLMAIASGFTYAAYVLLLATPQVKKIPSFLLCFYMASVSSVAMCVLCLVTGQLALPQSLAGWGLSALFAVGITCCAVVLFQLGTLLIGGPQTSILSTLEPITSVVVGVVIFKEAMHLRTFFGVLLVVFASVLIALSNFRPAKRRK